MILLLHLVCACHLFVALLLGQGLELQFTVTKLLCLIIAKHSNGLDS